MPQNHKSYARTHTHTHIYINTRTHTHTTAARAEPGVRAVLRRQREAGQEHRRVRPRGRGLPERGRQARQRLISNFRREVVIWGLGGRLVFFESGGLEWRGVEWSLGKGMLLAL